MKTSKMIQNRSMWGVAMVAALLAMIVPGAGATETEIREYSVFEADDTGSGTKSFEFDATPFDLSGTVDTSQSSTYMVFWADARCVPTTLTACQVDFTVRADNGTGAFVVPTTGPRLARPSGDTEGVQTEFGSWYNVYDMDTPMGSRHFGGTSWINVTVTAINADHIRYGFQVWQREIVTTSPGMNTLAEEVTVISVWDDWLPFLVFAAAALWGWTGRNLMLAVIGSVGMLGVFVLPLWSTAVLVLFGVLAIWADYFAHYGKKNDQDIQPGPATPVVGERR